MLCRAQARRALGGGGLLPLLSTRTFVYKGMLASHAAAGLLPGPRPTSASRAASRSCTRGSRPTPSRPGRSPTRTGFVAHNGEINTLAGNRNWMRAREALLGERALRGRPRAHLPGRHPGRQRLGHLRRGPRAAPPRRAAPCPRRVDDDPRGLAEPHRDGPRPAGLLPLPRLAHGALGRPGGGRLHRRDASSAPCSTATGCARPATG